MKAHAVEILEEYKDKADTMQFAGVPLSEFSKDEIMCMVAMSDDAVRAGVRQNMRRSHLRLGLTG